MNRARAVLLAVLLLLVAGTTVLPVPAAAAPCVQTDPIDRHYCELGGEASYLGPPVGGRYAVGAGVGQDYAGGRIFWSAPTGAHAVHGGIGELYRHMGGPLGLGFPQTDELPT